jgi:hypothetical protein
MNTLRTTVIAEDEPQGREAQEGHIEMCRKYAAISEEPVVLGPRLQTIQ